jgi:hypothetical protein
MQMLYNSENYAVVHFEVDVSEPSGFPMRPDVAEGISLTRAGYEIVDKHARREIFIEGALAEHFKEGVQALIEASPNDDDVDEYLAGYTVLAQQPVVLH